MTLENERLAQLQSTVERLASPVLIVDTDGRIITWNHAAEQLFSVNHGDCRGQPIEVLLDRARPSGPTSLPNPADLTQRQREVLLHIAEGWPTRDIAKKLKLSVKTIETHRAHLMQRLRVDSVARLVRYAVAVGLVPPGP